MSSQSRDISRLVFKRISGNYSSNVSINTRTLEVLMEIDGKKNLHDISRKTGIGIKDMRPVISNLLKQKLIAPSTNGVGVKVLTNGFHHKITAELALAVGPIAEVLVEDALTDLGLRPGRVPMTKAAQLIEMLSRDIQREDKKSAFIKNMIDLVKKY
jgi:hypothetical protein